MYLSTQVTKEIEGPPQIVQGNYTMTSTITLSRPGAVWRHNVGNCSSSAWFITTREEETNQKCQGQSSYSSPASLIISRQSLHQSVKRRIIELRRLDKSDQLLFEFSQLLHSSTNRVQSRLKNIFCLSIWLGMTSCLKHLWIKQTFEAVSFQSFTPQHWLWQKIKWFKTTW